MEPLTEQDSHKNNLKEIMVSGGAKIVLYPMEHEGVQTKEPDYFDSHLGKLSKLIPQATLVFLEYFPVEMERGVYSLPVVGKSAKEVGDKHGQNTVFKRITELCATCNKPVAVADIANRVRYLPYETIAALGWYIKSLYDQKTKPKTWFLDESDPFPMNYVRQTITALALRQTAMEYAPKNTLLFITPEAHCLGIARFLQELEEDNPKAIALAKLGLRLPGLDTSIRCYKPTGSKEDTSWLLYSQEKIKNKRNN